ncbi:MAG: bifunctional diaminohydroxyphosphoribosylaminopyrimidine deaminase/5-amino-6-(5-phosphoribosylamino)uracil reductase RibD [Gemmatimonadales bacterium]|nr:bifunctional diaminohydroxyphosphoribosylaminopyrimidine deaminase/5-amino-6-(5-phosphoribosylamino)uracil reductase RibD [Gemmatimonadota bacterium]MCL4212877.1 bifunctional diaminohydroxyphosphoribosylaminopyrimidine deaminase/5-amino-6-(5-phosphoribosylamino)uracil reductase RibD [Gemmatimonadales bacterium]
MRRALLLARRGWGRTAPNPLVGAVVVRDGKTVGEGFHAEFGGPHAEVHALAEAGPRAEGADVYVTLEPCAHEGKTPPCVDALIAARVRRVVVAARDPNPVAAGGIARLRAAGIAVTESVERRSAEDLNAPFLFVQREPARPFVTLKLAISLDGMLASADRSQRWLTGERARRHVHRLRAGVDGVAVGIGTALADDPALTVRSGRRPRVAPRRIVFDPSARLPTVSKLARTARKVPTWVLADAPDAGRSEALERAGVRVLSAPGIGAQLAVLRREGIHHLLVEGGAGMAGALLSGGFVDRLVIFQAPVLLGAGALPAFGSVSLGSGFPERWRVIEHRMFDDDAMVSYAPLPAPGR